jgi:two-component system LytT family response regulator
VDYLVKPFGRERLLETLDRVRVRLVGEARAAGVAGVPTAHPATRQYASRLFARHKGSMVPVSVSEIRQIDAVAGGVAVVTSAGTFDMDGTLGELEERLDPADFVRVHRAHLVNLAHVTGIRRYDERRLALRLDDGSTLVTSRRGAQALRAMGV